MTAKVIVTKRAVIRAHNPRNDLLAPAPRCGPRCTSSWRRPRKHRSWYEYC
jgi:hypothetical protein